MSGLQRIPTDLALTVSSTSYSAMIQNAKKRKEYKRRAEEAKKEWLLETDKPLSSKDSDFSERLESRKYLKEFADSAQAAYEAIKGTGEPDLTDMDSHELLLYKKVSSRFSLTIHRIQWWYWMQHQISIEIA